MPENEKERLQNKNVVSSISCSTTQKKRRKKRTKMKTILTNHNYLEKHYYNTDIHCYINSTYDKHDKL